MKNYYRVLGVSTNSTTDDIKKAYKQLIEQYHPILNSGDKYAQERFIDISVAYKTLSNKAKREDYNAILNSIGPIVQYNNQRHEENLYFATVAAPIIKTARYNKYPVYAAILLTTACLSVGLSMMINNLSAGKSNSGRIASIIKASPQPLKSIVTSITDINTGLPYEETAAIPAIFNSNSDAYKRSANTVIHFKKAHNTLPVVKAISPKKNEEVVVSTLPVEYAIGASRNDILKIQGSPNSIIRYDNEDEVWVYGGSKLHFNNGRLASYRNSDNNLLIRSF